LTKNWLTEALWASWSHAGQLKAAHILQKPVLVIAPTTNHLESFNGVLKQKYIGRFRKGGRRIRFDLLIYLLAIRILPGIFQQRSIELGYYNWVSERFSKNAGGRILVCKQDLSRKGSQQRTSLEQSSDFTWWSTDSQLLHQDEAQYIIRKQRIGEFHWIDGYTITATCASSLADIRTQDHIRYRLFLNCYGWGSCSCPSFTKHGTACKHLWAFRFVVIQMHTKYSFIFPRTEDEAASIYVKIFTNTSRMEDHHNSPPELVQETSRPPPPVNYASQIASATKDIFETLGEEIECDSINSSDEEISNTNSLEINVSCHSAYCLILLMLLFSRVMLKLQCSIKSQVV